MDITIRVFSAKQLDLVRTAVRNAITANVQLVDGFNGKSQKEIDRNQGLISLAEARINALQGVLAQLPTNYGSY
jgi:hypothetical protein